MPTWERSDRAYDGFLGSRGARHLAAAAPVKRRGDEQAWRVKLRTRSRGPCGSPEPREPKPAARQWLLAAQDITHRERSPRRVAPT